MRKHVGRREREARKRRMTIGKSWSAMSDRFGGVTLLLGRKKSAERGFNWNTLQLKKRFRGCVVDAER